MFCPGCGNEIKEGASFCGKCGRKVEIFKDPPGAAPYYTQAGDAYPETKEEPPQKEPKKKRKGLITGLIIAAAVIVTAAAVFAFFFLRAASDNEETLQKEDAYESDIAGFDSYEEVLNSCMDSIIDADLSGFFLTVPEEVLEDELEAYGYSVDELDEYLSEYNETIEAAWSYLDDVLGTWTLSYNIVSETEITGSELEEICENYSYYGIDVESAVYVEIELVVTSDEYDLDGLLDLDTLGFYFIESDGLWYLDIYSMDW